MSTPESTPLLDGGRGSATSAVRRRRTWAMVATAAFSCCLCYCFVVALVVSWQSFSRATGACCFDDGSCDETFSSGCSGTFLGFGTRCASNACPPRPPSPAPTPRPTMATSAPTSAPTLPPLGACCFTVAPMQAAPYCYESTTETACEAIRGVFSAMWQLDAACSDEQVCPNYTNTSGVCCRALPFGCTESLDAADCLAYGGAVSAPAAECSADGRACVPTATPAPSAAPSVAPTARPTFAPAVVGSCCGAPSSTVPTGACFDHMTSSECSYLGSTLFSDATFIEASSGSCATASFCDSVVSTSLCCQLSSGSCTDDVTFANCSSLLGGASNTFSQCSVTGMCIAGPTPAPTVSPTKAPTSAPTPRPTREPPTPLPTVPPTFGACCNTFTTTCTLKSFAACLSSFGSVFAGQGTNCSQPGFCGNPTPKQRPGACCHVPSLTCTDDIFETPCLEVGPDRIWAVNTTCANPSFCKTTGSCCQSCSLSSTSGNFCLQTTTLPLCEQFRTTFEAALVDTVPLFACSLPPLFAELQSCDTISDVCDSAPTGCCQTTLPGYGDSCYRVPTDAAFQSSLPQLCVGTWFPSATCTASGQCQT